MPPFLMTLFASGLNLLGNAVLAKGKDFVEEKLGVNLEQMVQTDEGKLKLAQIQMDNEESLRSWIVEIREQELKFQMAQETAVSDRWKSDMMSDSKLSKNIRPAVLIYLLVLLTALLGVSAAGLKIADNIVELVSGLLSIVFTAYFGGRSLEKLTGMIATKWAEGKQK